TAATFAAPTDKPLFEDSQKFVDETLELLNRHVKMGARGLKILKELGLHYKDASGKLIRTDDDRLAPIWEEAGKLGIPVLMHQSDPSGFFEPMTPENEHYESLKKYPSWSFADPKFPRKAELLKRRDNLIRRHPKTTFILAHVANFAENLPYVSRLLDENPNVYIDFSARMDELGRQPYTARKLFIRHQDRILFGTDMPASVEMYRCHFRFLETFDENFIPPDYDGTFGRYRWKISGIGLPKEVLKKIYHQNALEIIPGLKEDLKNSI
ncbi:MAG: amidohydrolase family protein, partial [Phycisphaerae bacterium]|nr:amidohydrolase family protein [Phycisphaerae bacterium]